MRSQDSGANENWRQLPEGSEIFLDHVGHFVRDPESTAQALRRAGFATTPVSVQVNPDAKSGNTLTGTGNVCAMLPRGYIECLFKTSDTPLAQELDIAIQRYSGVHLIAFSVRDADAAYARLNDAGFHTRPLVSMRRLVSTKAGQDVAAFTVVRLAPGVMPEGRIQLLRHHTEDAVWQPPWLTHPNSALGLLDVVIAVDNLNEAADRYALFLDRSSEVNPLGQCIRLERGRIQLVSSSTMRALLRDTPNLPTPFIGLYALHVRSLDLVERHLTENGLPFVRQSKTLSAPFPEQLGAGAWFFTEQPTHLPWRYA